MKHGEGKEQAHDMYVYEYCTFDEIAKRTGRSDKTIRNWADAEGWHEERERLFQRRRSTHEKLHGVVDALTDRLVDSIKNSENEIPAQSIHALTGLLSKLDSLYKYEKSVSADNSDETEKRDGLADDTIEKIERQLNLL